MKKAIFIVSVLFFLAGCKKEKIEPVEVSTDTIDSRSGEYHKPSKVEITRKVSGEVQTMYFSYYKNGLVKTIDFFGKSQNDSIIKYYQKSFNYLDEKLSNITLISNIGTSYIYSYSYINDKIRTYTWGVYGATTPTEIYTYSYDVDGNIEYVLANLPYRIDSIAYKVNKVNDSFGYSKTTFTGKAVGEKIDTSLHGYMSKYTQSWNINKEQFRWRSSSIYYFSAIKNKFELNVRNEIFGSINYAFLFSRTEEPNFFLENTNNDFHYIRSENLWFNDKLSYVVDKDQKIHEINYQSCDKEGYCEYANNCSVKIHY